MCDPRVTRVPRQRSDLVKSTIVSSGPRFSLTEVQFDRGSVSPKAARPVVGQLSLAVFRDRVICSSCGSLLAANTRRGLTVRKTSIMATHSRRLCYPTPAIHLDTVHPGTTARAEIPVNRQEVHEAIQR